MPYDSTTYAPQTDTKPITRLIEALRGPEPDYDGGCWESCAMHVAVRLGLCRDVDSWVGDGNSYAKHCCRQMGISGAEKIFLNAGGRSKEDTADRLEAWAKERGR